MNNYTTKDGRKFIIRQPAENDAERIITYSKILFASTDQVLTTPGEYNITVENEIAWIRNMNENPGSKLLIAELDNEIAGFLFFVAHTKRKSAHTGEFGVNVHPNYQGVGIATRLIEALLAWAKGNQQIEKVFLQVFATNDNAIALYKKMGFMEEGRHIKAIKQLSGEYADVIQMYIEAK